MKRFLIFLCLSALLVGCESAYENSYQQRRTINDKREEFERNYESVKNYVSGKLHYYPPLYNAAYYSSWLRKALRDEPRPKAGDGSTASEWKQTKEILRKWRERHSRVGTIIIKINNEVDYILPDFRVEMKKIEQEMAEFEKKIKTIDERFAIDKQRYNQIK